MQPLDDEAMETYQSQHRPHARLLREHTWLKPEERETICARCTLKKQFVITLSWRGERFGLCAHCLENLWSLASGER